MTAKSKLVVLLVACALVAGCSPTHERKVKLLRQIKEAPTAELYFQLGQVYQEEQNWYLTEYYYDLSMGFERTGLDAQAANVASLKGEDAKSAALTAIGSVSHSAADSLRLATAFEKQGLDDYALACYNQALALAPNSARANLLVSYFYGRQNENAKAKEYLVKSYQLCPKQNSVPSDLGRQGIPMQLPQ